MSIVNWERELFTALFTWPEEVPSAISSLRADHFEDEEHRKLFTSIQKNFDAGAGLDSMSAVQGLMVQGVSQDQASEIVSRALDGSPIRVNIARYISEVRDKARKHRLTSLMESTKARAESGESASELTSETLQGIWNIQDDIPTEPIREAKEVAGELAAQAFEERSRPDEISGISTGIESLDFKTTGIRPGELWIAGALPGRGKTALGVQVATFAASRGMPVMFFSLEMARTELIRRIAGAEIGAWDVRNPRQMAPSSWDRFMETVADIGTWPLFIDDSSSLSPIEVAAHSRVAIRRHGVKLVIVDYLQLLRSPGRELRERVGAAANALRELAKQTGVPVLALSQLRRPGDLNDRPTMIDLKESGDIEAHAHTVLLLYMPMGEDDAPAGEDEIIIGKQRNGPIGAIPVYFDRKRLVFRERTNARG